MNNQRIIKIYDYRNAQGDIVFQVVRFDPKRFLQRRPFKNGYIWGLTEGWYKKEAHSKDYCKIKDALPDKTIIPIPDAVWFDAIEPVLYRLPELLEGIQNKEIVIISEGERDVDNIVTSLGFIATTCPMGAGKWKNTYTESLREYLNAVIIADKDEPGRAHAQTVANELYSVGILVKVMEMPDMNGAPIKDFSDWQAAGGTREAFLELLKQCPDWAPTQQDHPKVTAAMQLADTSTFQELTSKFGQPYYFNEEGKLTSINQTFWAGLHQSEHIQFFAPEERAFYRYNPENGLYSVISEDIIKQEVAARILEVSREKGLPALESKRTDSNLIHIVSLLRGIAEKKNAFSRNNKIVHLGNGVIVLKDNREVDFCAFSPDFCSRNQSPISFDPNAKCPRFLNEFLYPAVSSEDAILIQKYFGLCLIGNNLVQRFLILDGQSGRGKSTIVLIIQKCVGQTNVTQLRTKLLNERFELFRYLKKTLLTGIDVPGSFLSEKGAQVIKGLVGGDWFDAEQKNGTGSFPFQGNFCILITSNSRLRVYLDGDIKAWKRRLTIVRVKDSVPPKNIPHFADLLIQEEGSGILNWGLDGLRMALEDIEAFGDIKLMEAQHNIVDALLAESDSLRHFLVENLVRDENADLSTAEIVEAYAEYCPQKGWNAKPITVIYKELESLMLELFGTSKSGSIEREGKNVKGFRKVTFKTKGNE